MGYFGRFVFCNKSKGYFGRVFETSEIDILVVSNKLKGYFGRFFVTSHKDILVSFL